MESINLVVLPLHSACLAFAIFPVHAIKSDTLFAESGPFFKAPALNPALKSLRLAGLDVASRENKNVV
jgi:hypothetical protein